MALFKKLYNTNKKIAGSKLFLLLLLTLLVLLIIGALYIFLPDKSFGDLSSYIPAEINIFDSKKSPEVSEDKYNEYQVELSSLFELGNEKAFSAIKKLEELEPLPKLLENRKNYVLMTLYRNIKEPALAFITADQVSKDYLTEHTLYQKAMMAKDIGLESVVVDNLLYLINKYPKQAKYEYELAKSYSRQNLHEEAIKHFTSIQEVYPKSDYAIGAEYYLANLSPDAEVTRKKLQNYIQKSPEGSLANLAATQLLTGASQDDVGLRKLANNIAISYYKQGQYQKALGYFNPDLDRPEFFLEAYAESLANAGQKTKAREALIKYLPRVNDKEKAKELVDYLVKISRKSESISALKKLRETVLENIKDKVIWELAKLTRLKQDFVEIYTDYPDSFYAAESMAKVFWQEYKRKNYVKAIELSKKHWALYEYASSHPHVAYWAAKILFKQEKETEAREVLNKIINEHPHNYYAYRAKQLLARDMDWYMMPSANKFVGFPNWNWPSVYDDEKVVEKYGEDILELTKIKQFKYLLGLDDKKYDKKFKMYLEANSGDNIHAIRTAFFSIKHEEKPNHNDVLFQYAFPLAYADLIFDRAGKNQKVDPMLVHSLIRQESFYQKDIVSKVGAIGLMQLMPYTAKTLSRQMNMRPPRRYDLMQPAKNISLGVRYMEQVFAEFKNNMINAIASYNAGPGAVNKWIKTHSFSDPDEYIENIPYKETREYVKRVLNNYWVYRDLYS